LATEKSFPFPADTRVIFSIAFRMNVGHNKNILGAVFPEVNLVWRESESEHLYMKEFTNNHFRFSLLCNQQPGKYGG
jgi:hypothetical protein